jgi:hypothetical protein
MFRVVAVVLRAARPLAWKFASLLFNWSGFSMAQQFRDRAGDARLMWAAQIEL